jgi:FkbH-like protein
MVEAVRLVIWDLDETFWRGTHSEGGIQEYIQQHHDIVIELARRGIISSICSKNDSAVILPILEEKGILEYFVFPSISWEPKGMRLARLVETFQLRAPTAMFIDDNPNNRAEAAAVVPGLQVEDEHFIPQMLDDWRFEGKNDSEFSRLKQYKLLETRKRDQESAVGGNEAFLRSCGIRVFIDYDVEASIDRAIELVNRTNQLNFTKKRLPEDKEAARQELRQAIGGCAHQAGLVRVVDNYGDYGYVGFFMTQALRSNHQSGQANRTLLHFCFSCRTLGMLIEQWVYNFLGKPELHVVGDVLTDLSIPREIDWVRQVQSLEDTASTFPQVAQRIIYLGGCEAHAIGVYLNAYTPQLNVIGNYAANGFFVRVNSAAMVLDTCDRKLIDFEDEAKALGIAPDIHVSDFFNDTPKGTLYLFNLGLDYHVPGARIQHKRNKWSFFIEPRLSAYTNLVSLDPTALAAHLDVHSDYYSSATRECMLRVHEHIRTNYDVLPYPTEADRIQGVRNIVARVPRGSKCIFIIDYHKMRWDGELSDSADIRSYTKLVRDVADEFPYVGVVSLSDVLKSEDEVLDGNHYVREVYLRCANKVIEIAESLRPRGRTYSGAPMQTVIRTGSRCLSALISMLNALRASPVFSASYWSKRSAAAARGAETERMINAPPGAALVFPARSHTHQHPEHRGDVRDRDLAEQVTTRAVG